MKIEINDSRRISEIQESFRKVFPYLTIGFFIHYSRDAVRPTNGVSGMRKIGECRTIHASGEMTITPAMTIHELEEIFRTRYGLEARVFRQSGKAWLGTSVTNDWTLDEQNKEGEALSQAKKLMSR